MEPIGIQRPATRARAYRVSDVDIQGSRDTGGGFNVGWIADGEWLDYAIRVQSAGFYALSVRVASRYVGTSLRVLVNGEDVTGSVTVPATGDWQAWQTVTHGDVYLPVGIHRLTLSAGTGGFNVNWMSLSASAGPTHALPATIQAEDFREGGYWDSTSGNNGGLYRTTDVDVQTCQDAGGGFNVGWIAPGEWLEYTIVVRRAGYYDLSARVASRYSGKSFSMLWNGTDVTGIVSVPNTGGWQNWETVTRRNIYLPAGTHTATVLARTNAFNLNWLTFTTAGATAEAGFGGRAEQIGRSRGRPSYAADLRYVQSRAARYSFLCMRSNRTSRPSMTSNIDDLAIVCVPRTRGCHVGLMEPIGVSRYSREVRRSTRLSVIARP